MKIKLSTQWIILEYTFIIIAYFSKQDIIQLILILSSMTSSFFVFYSLLNEHIEEIKEKK